ncbi:MAG: YdcF family protein [Gemmatimonadaceae bacterium]
MALRTRRTLTWLFLAPLTGWLLMLAAIVLWAERNATNSADVIVVLGAAQYDGRPSPVLKARLDHAVGLYKQGLAPRLLLTGGRREGDAVSEAVAGQRYSVKMGVPPNAIMLEGVSRTTLASIQGTARLLRADSNAQAPRVLLVSDPFHMLRVSVLARLYGLNPSTSPTRTSPISASRSVALEYVLRESVALPADVATAMWERLVAP